MVKAFDTAVLLEKLKGHGLDIGEHLIMSVVTDVLDWTQESLVIHENPYVKMAAPVVALVKQPILEAIDRIDGEKN